MVKPTFKPIRMTSIPDRWRLAERIALAEFTQGAVQQIKCWGLSKAPPIYLNNSYTPGTFSYGTGLQVRHNLHSIEVLLALKEDGYDTNCIAHVNDPSYGLKWMFFHDSSQIVYNLAQHLYQSGLVDPELLQELENIS